MKKEKFICFSFEIYDRIYIVGDRMIPIEKKTINNKNYTMYLPDNKSSVVEVKFRVNNGKMFNIKNNEVLIQISKDMTEKDILEAIKSSVDEITNREYRAKEIMTFEVDSEEEMQRVNEIINMGFEDILKTNKSKEYYNEAFKSYLATMTIQKMENGRINNYVIANEDNINREFVLAGIDAKKMEQAFQELILEGDLKQTFDNKTPQEVSNIVLNYIANRDNLKRYMLGSKEDVVINDKMSNAVQGIATMDDKVNSEIGIVKNDVKDGNAKAYQTVSMDGDNVNIAELNPGMISASASNNGNNTTSTSSENYNDVSMSNDLHVEEQNREELKTFYLDDEGNLYNLDGNILGNINNNSDYKIDYMDNSVYHNDVKVGILDDYRMMGISQEKQKNNTLKRVLVPNNNNNNGIVKISIMGVLLGLFIMMIMYLLVR